MGFGNRQGGTFDGLDAVLVGGGHLAYLIPQPMAKRWKEATSSRENQKKPTRLGRPVGMILLPGVPSSNP
jgi:hypothetical protein